MKRIAIVFTLFAFMLGISLPAQAAKPASSVNQAWSTQVTSAYDGSQWLLVQADRISQPGNAHWYISWVKADGSPCFVQLGWEGTQTGATWGPTSYTFAYYGQPVTESLQLGESYPKVVDVTSLHFVENCSYGILRSTAKDAILDPYVPLPWSAPLSQP
jgi:hypothetical protein